METTENDKRQLDRALGALEKADLNQLIKQYRELWHVEPPARNRQFLLRHIAWRIQTNAEGDLSEEVRQYAIAIARATPIRTRVADNVARRRSGLDPVTTISTTLVSDHDSRLPMPGSLLIKDYRGQTYVVQVLNRRFEFAGKHYGSLSAIARDITGTKWNGYVFFGLQKGDRLAH